MSLSMKADSQESRIYEFLSAQGVFTVNAVNFLEDRINHLSTQASTESYKLPSDQKNSMKFQA